MVNTYEIKGRFVERHDRAPFDGVLWWEEKSDDGKTTQGCALPVIYGNSAVRKAGRECRGKLVQVRGFINPLRRKNGIAFYITELEEVGA